MRLGGPRPVATQCKLAPDRCRRRTEHGASPRAERHADELASQVGGEHSGDGHPNRCTHDENAPPRHRADAAEEPQGRQPNTERGAIGHRGAERDDDTQPTSEALADPKPAGGIRQGFYQAHRTIQQGSGDRSEKKGALRSRHRLTLVFRLRSRPSFMMGKQMSALTAPAPFMVRRTGNPPSTREVIVYQLVFAFVLAASGLAFTLAADRQRLPSGDRGGGRAVAVTFDDLPARGDLATMRETTHKLLRILVAERIPATGFVNEAMVVVDGELADRTALLTAWLDGGFDLGNHTYSHVPIDRVPFEVYKADLIKGEAVTRRLLEARGRRLRYFRHPQLRTGPTPEYKAALDALLVERGYRVAPVTLDNNDFVFADVYGRARMRGDQGTMARVAAAYVPYMERVLAHFEGLSQQFLGYELSQVLLLHANELNADVLPALVDMLRARMYTFVSLDDALEDPAYRLPEAPAARGLSWLHRWMLAKGLPMQPEPTEPPFVRELFNAVRR